MHTVMVISGGLLLLAISLLVGRATGHAAAAVTIFIPVWLAASLINLWIGVSRAGYTVLEELPILVPVFGVPAVAAAAILWWLPRA
jgi:hypothetical protein